MTGQSVFISALTCVLLGCSGSSSPPDEPAFRHDVSGDVRPWTNEAFDSADDKSTFAVFSDLTGGEREGIFEIRNRALEIIREEGMEAYPRTEYANLPEQSAGNIGAEQSGTGGVQFPELGRSMDQVTLVTVSESGADIANLLMEGILDKTGHIPLRGDELCFEAATCLD